MTTLQIHMHESRGYLGEATAEPLLDWLNAKRRKKPMPGRIEQLLAAAARRSDASEPVTPDMFDRMLTTQNVPPEVRGAIAETTRQLKAVDPDRSKPARLTDYLAASREINSILARYRLTPILLASSEQRWTVDWHPSGRGVTRAEGRALLSLLNLAAEGLLLRVKQCANAKCNQWFYARFEHQRFHSQQCQQETFRTDEEWKRKRREYMKKLRRDAKNRSKGGRS